MLTLEEIREALKTFRLEQVAADTGLSFYTVKRYAEGAVTDPPMKTITILSEYLTGPQTAA